MTKSVNGYSHMDFGMKSSLPLKVRTVFSYTFKCYSMGRLENDMDGDALALAFAAHSGPDCLKDVVSKYGFRLKVYQAIKAELEANRTQVKF